jgi:hypothetical protein
MPKNLINRVGKKLNFKKMNKSKISSIKKLSKNEQKAIVGGICNGGGYPAFCPELGRKVCPSLC